MIRILFLGLAIFLAISIIKKLLVNQKNQGSGPSQSNPTQSKKDPALMQKCAHCDIHILESKGLRSNDTFFCSSEHQHAYEEKP